MTPKQFARVLRKNCTPEESIMWGLLRNRQLLGYKFLRQHPIKIWETSGNHYFYFADFYCAEKKLVIEIDGLIHTLQEDYDRSRDVVMKEFGYTVLRITNKEVNQNALVVLQSIKQILNLKPLSTCREG
jgi:very-short-patch-repair endonuclease